MSLMKGTESTGEPLTIQWLRFHEGELSDGRDSDSTGTAIASMPGLPGRAQALGTIFGEGYPRCQQLSTGEWYIQTGGAAEKKLDETEQMQKVVVRLGDDLGTSVRAGQGGKKRGTVRCCDSAGGSRQHDLKQCEIFSKKSECGEWLASQYRIGKCYPANAKFLYHGCWETDLAGTKEFSWPGGGIYNSVSHSIVEEQQIDLASMSPERCAMMCEGFLFFSLSERSTCSCSNEELGTKVPDVECDLPCVGNTHLACGGNGKASVFTKG